MSEAEPITAGTPPAQPITTPTPVEVIPPATPAPEKSVEDIAQEELDELNREIEEANKSLVSEDTSKLIKLEREAAKKEAEKEFLVNQRVKELEAEKEQIKKEAAEKEKAFALKMEALTNRVNGMVASKAPVVNDNPFNAQPPAPNPNQSTEFTEDEVRDIELASMEAFFDAKSRDKNRG
jgi:hypothetical protein